MKKFILSLVGLFLFVSLQSQASHTTMVEFEALKSTISKWTADGMVGGLYNEKNFGDYVILWKFENGPRSSEVIRIYRPTNKVSGAAFSVTYFKNTMIVPGQMVLRRFVGPDQTGWRNDTFNYATGAYLGSQGLENPRITGRDLEIMKTWGITL